MLTYPSVEAEKAQDLSSIVLPKIQIKDLNVTVDGKQILKNISLDIPNNSITSIIGPSGCGKTTLLKTLNRLLDDQKDVEVSGSVLVNNEDIYAPGAEVTHIRKKMGLLSQKPFPLPMSIFDNIAYGPKIHGIRDKKTLRAIVEQQLVNVGLWEEVKDRLDSSATRLSIGQQQRLCLARGLAVEPEIILGDESTSALDPISTQTIENLLVQLKEDYTIVLVTHILRQARRVSDYILFLYNGEIVEFGKTDDILLNPQNEITKQYVKGYIS
ncbi:ATP-binding cassette domain-containing protein [Sphingobacterium sp. DK4209]|uniref:ATP-binding cassette domain-containing protein n=1 Tax=Sphingobacterium zhuxiongii TaxID=2662364 RepID=A0A5Q0QAK8_9SPHI|nr:MULTISPECIES: phosphate ABC transporter ATP-binding protein [unclassified Sphingobacterium]MVZ66186.1 ATP-binding cassette domain-containing protein [Sphingobacterium sp. DK4209]QGA26603.1 ATP-binding cassette domain-containing protein [Sphingobacterium sp. dk4302]